MSAAPSSVYFSRSPPRTTSRPSAIAAAMSLRAMPCLRADGSTATADSHTCQPASSPAALNFGYGA